MARATWKGAVIADSADVIVVDGYTYFPREAVRWDLLERSEHRSVCSWKGEANYYAVRVNGALNPAAAWEYAEPRPAAAVVKDRVGFWRGVQIEP